MRAFSYLNCLKKPRKHLLSLLRNERWLLASMGFNNMILSKIINYYKWEAVINFWGKKEKNMSERRKETIEHVAGRVLNSSPPCFPLQYTNELS